MKRTVVIAALAFALLLSACGASAQDAPTPTPVLTETPDAITETPEAENGGLSALSEWALGELEYTRSLNYQ